MLKPEGLCNQCCKDIGVPEGQLKGMLPKKIFNLGLAYTVLCADCGITQIDYYGNCRTRCNKNHWKNPKQLAYR